MRNGRRPRPGVGALVTMAADSGRLAVAAVGLVLAGAAVLVLQLLAEVVSWMITSGVSAYAGLAVGLGLAVPGVVVIGVQAVRRVVRRMHDAEAQQDALDAELQRLDSELRTTGGRMHEVGSIAAGLAAAAKLLDSAGHSADEAHTLRLRQMLQAEAERLHRLVDDSLPRPVALSSVDEVVWPIVVRTIAAGQRVAFRPGDALVSADADAVAQILSTLLDNARRHAPGSSVQVDADLVDLDTVEISVTDDGPGIDAVTADELFTWGARGSDSPGHGIGLHAARQLALQEGGDLRLDPTPYGSRFVLTLPGASGKERHDVPRRPGHVA
ncbi:ATP-binding protein [Nocardioides sp. BSK12Z-3]|nr:ATP-binding protein [Nocardioides bruguierae]